MLRTRDLLDRRARAPTTHLPSLCRRTEAHPDASVAVVHRVGSRGEEVAVLDEPLRAQVEGGCQPVGARVQVAHTGGALVAEAGVLVAASDAHPATALGGGDHPRPAVQLDRDPRVDEGAVVLVPVVRLVVRSPRHIHVRDVVCISIAYVTSVAV